VEGAVALRREFVIQAIEVALKIDTVMAPTVLEPLAAKYMASPRK
jgi:hypothetical protein